MEGHSSRRECQPTRCYQCNRLEDQLWEAAYQRLWPLVGRSLKKENAQLQQRPAVVKQPLAKGA